MFITKTLSAIGLLLFLSIGARLGMAQTPTAIFKEDAQCVV